VEETEAAARELRAKSEVAMLSKQSRGIMRQTAKSQLTHMR